MRGHIARGGGVIPNPALSRSAPARHDCPHGRVSLLRHGALVLASAD
jgi:hypothetical protein